MDAAEISPDCGCKGVRFCALCKDSVRVRQLNCLEQQTNICSDLNKYCYCLKCGYVFAWSNDRIATLQSCLISELCASHSKTKTVPRGLLLLNDFLTESEESDLVSRIDSVPWLLSQSGRRKQDYGPKVNFKKQKVKLDSFIGMPDYADLILDKMKQRSADHLSKFVVSTLLNLGHGTCFFLVTLVLKNEKLRQKC